MNYKYNEDVNIAKLKEYVDKTYNQHYVGDGGIQTFDVWDTLNIAPEVCRGTPIKYLMRFGKKDGYNEKDLLKAAHYVLLLMHYMSEQMQGE